MADSPRTIDWAGPEPLLAGITAASELGEQLSVTRYTLAEGAVVPEHVHDAEEFGQVLSGTLLLTVDGATATVATGEGFLIRGGVPHSAVTEGGCDLLECYAPPRLPQPGGGR
jgi:quercetin dioxygenase-like cupin family protein